MKKFFIAMLLIFILLAIGIFVFLLIFDINRYNPLFVEKIGHAIQKDVKIGNISLNVFPCIAVKIDGLFIKDTNKAWDESILKASSIEANLALLPLLKKDIQIDRLHIRGLDITLTKDSMLIPSRQTDAEGDTNAPFGIAGAGSLKFLAKSISITDSSVTYIGDIAGRPLHITIDIIDAFIRNISLYGPVHIEAKLSVFGRGKENIKCKLVLYPEFETKKPYIKNLEIKTDLARFDFQSILEALGKTGLSEQLIGKGIAGDLIINSEKLFLDLKNILQSEVYISLSKGAINGLTDVKLEGQVNIQSISIQGLSGLLAGGNFSGKGAIKNVLSGQTSSFELMLQDIDVAKLLPEVPSNKPYLEGLMDIDIKTYSKGLESQKMLDNLAGEGTVKLDKAVLKNINVLKVALDKLHMLPGLLVRLENNLPSHYKELLEEKDTVFKPMNTKFGIKDKKLLFQEAVVESDAFYLVSEGSLGIDRELDIHANLFIPQDLSQAFIAVVTELQYLQNTKGLITMPIYINGKAPDVSIRPDLEYVIQRLAVSKGQELLQSIFEKSSPKKTDGEAGGETREEGEPAQVIMKTIFDIITTPKESPEPNN